MRIARFLIYGFIGMSLVGGTFDLHRIFNVADLLSLAPPSTYQAEMSQSSSTQHPIQQSNTSGHTERQGETTLIPIQELPKSTDVSLDQLIAEEQVLLNEQREQGGRAGGASNRSGELEQGMAEEQRLLKDQHGNIIDIGTNINDIEESLEEEQRLLQEQKGGR